MSVITWDGEIIAADKQATRGDMAETCSKIWPLPNGEIFACTGDLAHGVILSQWYVSGADPKEWPDFQKTEEWTRIIIANAYGVKIYDQHPVAIIVHADFNAWGTGCHYAMGAMAMGATPMRAVEIASEHDIYCGRGVDHYSLSNRDEVTT